MHTQEDSTRIFTDLRTSVYLKAATICPDDSEINSGTTIQYERKPSLKNNLEYISNGSYQNSDFFPSVNNMSTPKHENQIKSVNKPFSNETAFSRNLFEKKNQFYKMEVNETPANSFLHEKVLQQCDKERSAIVQKFVEERIKNMEESDRKNHDSSKQLWKGKIEENYAKRLCSVQKILKDIHEQELKNRPIREAQLAEDNMRNAQRLMDRNQRVKDAENEAIKKSEALKLNKILRDKMFEYQKEYGKQYKEVHTIINSCENKNKFKERSLSTMKGLKNLSVEYDRLFKKAKTSELTEEDVNGFMKIVEMLKVIHKTLKKDIDDINTEEKEEPDVKIEEKIEPVKTDTVHTAKSEQSVSDLSDCFDSQSLQTYLNLKSYLENFEKSCKNLMEDSSMKKFRFSCQKAVTIPVNAISPVSGPHLSDKYIKLHSLLTGKMVDIGSAQVSASQHPEGIAYCKKLLAKKFVRQGDLTVSSKPDAAFSIAAVLASLWVDFPDFGQLTLAYFQHFCPYLAPVFMPQVEGQSIEDYHKSLGYHYTENGEVEKQDSFLKRMSGIMRLYAALLITKVRQPGRQNPLGIAEGWRWIAAILNLEPRPDICTTLLYDFLEVAGNEMFKTYGAQFKKLLAYICQVYYPKLEKITPGSSGGPLVRLEEFLQKIMKSERIAPPEGLLPPNFW